MLESYFSSGHDIAKLKIKIALFWHCHDVAKEDYSVAMSCMLTI